MKSLLLILVFIITSQSYAQKSNFDPMDFKKADSIALAHKGEGLKNLPELAHLLTSNLETDSERFRAIYKWVCENIANDYGLYFRNKRKRDRFKEDTIKLKEWNSEFKKKLFKKLLKNQRTICTGYAYILKELSNLANLECEIVQGYGRVSATDIENLVLPNHSWNAIKLNNKWYLCDPTWASGLPNPETNRFQFQYNDGFFLANPELFAVNHFPVEQKWWLTKDIQSFQNFLESPIIYGKAYEYLAFHDAPKKLYQNILKNESVTFKYQLQKEVKEDSITFLIDSGAKNWTTTPTSIQMAEKVLTLKHQFKTSGFYDVHLYFGSDLIATYTVDVKDD